MKWISKIFGSIPSLSGVFSKALLGAFAMLLAVGVFQHFQIKSLNESLSETRVKQELVVEKNKTLITDIESMRDSLERNREASSYWRDQHTLLQKKSLELEEKYEEAIKKAPKKEQECLNTPLSDDVFDALTGM